MPTYRSYWHGSSFLIDAENDQARQFTCTYSYSFSYDDFGVRRERTESGSFFIPAASVGNNGLVVPWRGTVLQASGSWLQPEKNGEPVIRCG